MPHLLERVVMFSISPNEGLKIAEWQANHDCKITETGAIGGKYTFKFTPTGLGVKSEVECACGDNFDFTEYESW